MKGQADGIRVLVVDDEPPARQRLMEILRLDPDVISVLEAEDGNMALQLIESEKPDVVFLDVQMPERTGIEVVNRLDASRMPLVVFVTAYDQHAIRAFEANALDYLLKPFSDERLEAAFVRVKERLGEKQLHALGKSVLGVLATHSVEPAYRDRFVVKMGTVTHLINAREIDWIEGAGVYVTLHVANKEYLYRAPLQELTESLDARKFIRVHRSAIVNLESIVRLETLSHGEFKLLLKSGPGPRVSRTYRPLLEKRLGVSL
jgi:two-component system LytT family response regulator